MFDQFSLRSTPFVDPGGDDQKTMINIIKCETPFKEERWATLSKRCRSFVEVLLEEDVEKRCERHFFPRRSLCTLLVVALLATIPSSYLVFSSKYQLPPPRLCQTVLVPTKLCVIHGSRQKRLKIEVPSSNMPLETFSSFKLSPN
jgi:hypothetical protein